MIGEAGVKSHFTLFSFSDRQQGTKKQIRTEIVEQNEIWHSFILSLCQGHLPHLLPVSQGPPSKWKPSQIFWNCKMLTLRDFSQWVVCNIVQAKVMVEILTRMRCQNSARPPMPRIMNYLPQAKVVNSSCSDGDDRSEWCRGGLWCQKSWNNQNGARF